MGRWKTIMTMVDMEHVYTEGIRTDLLKKYRNEELPEMGNAAHRHLVGRACEMAEKAQDFELPEEDIRAMLIWFGLAMDAQKNRLDVKKYEEDCDISGIIGKINGVIQERKKETRAVLERMNEVIGEEEWEQIKVEYRLRKDWKKAVSDHWHKIIVGDAMKLAKTIIAEGGPEEDIRLALLYLKVCIDSNKHLLDYMRFKHEHGIVELSVKYNVRPH